MKKSIDKANKHAHKFKKELIGKNLILREDIDFKELEDISNELNCVSFTTLYGKDESEFYRNKAVTVKKVLKDGTLEFEEDYGKFTHCLFFFEEAEKREVNLKEYLISTNIEEYTSCQQSEFKDIFTSVEKLKNIGAHDEKLLRYVVLFDNTDLVDLIGTSTLNELVKTNRKQKDLILRMMSI